MRWLIASSVALLAGSVPRPVQQHDRPFDLLSPSVAVTAADRARLDAGATVVRAVPETGGRVAIFGARRVLADGDRLVAWIRHIEQFKAGKFVDGIARFSDPPALEDVASLSLDQRELETLRECRPGSCRSKLTAAEAAAVQTAVLDAGEGWRPVLQDLFRRLIVDRVRVYRAGGHPALGPYIDGRSPAPPDAVFRSLIDQSPWLTGHFPELAVHLLAYPRSTGTTFESFLYWSQERFGARPVVTATHVVIHRGTGASAGDAVVVGRQLFATHYMNGSLNLTAVLGSGPGSAHYLVVFNRMQLDVIRGVAAALTRRVIERRLTGELSAILAELARRLESGPPPVAP
jgi:hypothetical protein